MTYKIWTVVMIQNGDKVLLLDRQRDNFKGFIPPGGRVEFPKSFVDGAIREVREETGLEVRNLIFKGISEFVNPTVNKRYIMMNYWTNDFTGELLENPPEGELHWIKIEEAKDLPMQEDIKIRFDLFFEPGTFEIQTVWNEEKNKPEDVFIKKT
ncbi:DNA mismatch repair protein MutT [Bacillus cytotoxicus]|nr:8-oxo-dGTP diphosphatase [Bacillus cytotoxicus]AWC38880.1 8-oxo-dGTP diphosphatase [Bacillus cytotoxicus]AWC63096.1 8-oxo-dGTP diphosphatase [Bacillus cytotoxicus]KMT51358.1 DNA mismatch repair protein MutT [Bacillus cytotoxicus]